MFSSPSGIYRSKVLSSILRQTRRWSDRGKAALRRAQMAASWSAQIVLYPIYALFQTSRVLGAQVYQTVQLGIPCLRSTTASTVTDAPSDSSSPPLTVDTPIATILQTIQAFTLPMGVPVLLETSEAIVPLGTTATALPGAMPTLASGAMGIAIPGAPVFIQGIATLLDTRTVVLVTNQNHVLNILTPEQQAQLQSRITWEVATYGRSVNLRKTLANLSLPLMGWGRSQLNPADPAQVVNPRTHIVASVGHRVLQRAQRLGSEVYQIVRSGLFGRSLLGRESPALPGTSWFTATVDTPLEQALQTVQRFPLPMHLLAAVLEPTSTSLVPVRMQPDQLNSPELVSSQIAAIPPILTIPPDLAALPALYVRGVASLLDTQAIVLVTNQNQLLNLLSPEQQTQVRQQISWAVAHFYRYQQIRQAVRRSFSQLRPPEQQVLLPIRGFYQLMAWVQSGSVAIATNLFQEATLAARRAWFAERSLLDLPIPDWSYPHPIAPARPALPSTAPTAPRRLAPGWLESAYQQYGAWLNSRAVQTAIGQIQAQVTALLPPAQPGVEALATGNLPNAEQRSLREPVLEESGLEFGSTARQVLLSWQEATLALENSADIWDSYAPSPHFAHPADVMMPVAMANSATAGVTPTPSDYIDTQASLLGYLHSPLERLLQWLDRLLLWIEDTVIRVWRWWQQVRDDRRFK
ncbi:hypothetical protein ACN4EK_23390 [Pantanalinema rosaneae CENA516]|uniref:hypothetical protein n=1 Tax=Pantanalinema rosaneae TaxID=1620701 RepID=UPI003D6F0339